MSYSHEFTERNSQSRDHIYQLIYTFHIYIYTYWTLNLAYVVHNVFCRSNLIYVRTDTLYPLQSAENDPLTPASTNASYADYAKLVIRY